MSRRDHDGGAIRTLSLLGCVLSGLWSRPSAARPLVKHECATLFGDPQDVDVRRLHREASLRFVEVGEPYVVIAHSTEYHEPRPAHFADIELIAVNGAEERATVVVVPESASPDCPAGRYEIFVDDAFGAKGQVMAIFDQIVLLEIESELRFLSLNELHPHWSMAWISSWPINPYRVRPTSAQPVPQPKPQVAVSRGRVPPPR